ncbi:MAG TPA: hypothetical protein VFR81_05220 [Longimicrobium sp.]|nr:hypothetical protein [Longimicrobium sp.]
MTIRLCRRAIGAAVVAALGFGASQALASPAEAAGAAACDIIKCRANCKAQGQTSGACFGDQCVCYIVAPT